MTAMVLVKNLLIPWLLYLNTYQNCLIFYKFLSDNPFANNNLYKINAGGKLANIYFFIIFHPHSAHQQLAFSIVNLNFCFAGYPCIYLYEPACRVWINYYFIFMVYKFCLVICCFRLQFFAISLEREYYESGLTIQKDFL